MNIVLLISPGKTGGPEAIHQFADTLVSLGFNAYIQYVYEVKGALQPSNNTKNQYPEYQGIRIIQDYNSLCDVVLVLPEVWAHLSLDIAKTHMVLVWWLSVDYGLMSLGRIGSYLDFYRSHPGILNAYQSTYAKVFLQSLGLDKHDLSLSDYTIGHSLANELRFKENSRNIKICFNPSKGLWLAELFKARNPEATLIPIAGMSTVEVRKALAEAHAYVEFGQLPGKDRLPREALLLGTNVFMRLNGDGAFETDWLLPDVAYFTAEDCTSGALMKAIRSQNNSDPSHWQKARQKVACEKEVFVNECLHVTAVVSHLLQQQSNNSLIRNKINLSNRVLDPLSTVERRLDSVLNSTSWKILAPLRRALAMSQGINPSVID